MLVTISGLLRRSTKYSACHKFIGAALQPVADYASIDRLSLNAVDSNVSSLRCVSSASASTSTAATHVKSSSDRSILLRIIHVSFFGSSLRHASTASGGHAARRREILRDASKKVSPESTWLLAYSQNIDARQLTYRLGKRSTLHALEEGWTLYERKFDTIAMAALLRRLRVAQIREINFDPVAAQKLLDALEPRLHAITRRFGKLHDTVAYLHGLAKLRSPHPKAPAPGVAGLVESFDDDDNALGVVASSRGALAATEESNTVPHVRQLGHPVDVVLDLAVWATRDQTQMLHSSPRRLATLLWALLRMVPPGLYGSEKLQMVLDRISMCSILQGRSFAPQDLRVYVLAFATFGPRGMSAVEATRDASPQQAPDEYWTRSGRSWLSNVGPFPKSQKGQLTPLQSERADASTLAGASDDADGGSTAELGDDDGAEAREMKRRKRNEVVLQVMVDQLTRRVGDPLVAQPKPRDLVLAAHAWSLQDAPAPHMELFVMAADAAARGTHSLLALELVLLVETLAKYGVRQPVLLETVRQCARGWSAGAERGESGSETVEAGTDAAAKQQRALQERLATAFASLGVEL